MSDVKTNLFFLEARNDEIKRVLADVLDAVLTEFDRCPLSVRNAANRAVDVILTTKEQNDVGALNNEELKARERLGQSTFIDTGD